MKLIAQYQDTINAERVSARLRRKGILTYVSGRRLQIAGLARYTGAFKIGLWAVLPDQYEDARILLENRRHEPAVVLSADEMERLERESRASLSVSFRRSIERFLAIVFGAAIVLLVVIVGVAIWNDT